MLVSLSFSISKRLGTSDGFLWRKGLRHPKVPLKGWNVALFLTFSGDTAICSKVQAPESCPNISASCLWHTDVALQCHKANVTVVYHYCSEAFTNWGKKDPVPLIHLNGHTASPATAVLVDLFSQATLAEENPPLNVSEPLHWIHPTTHVRYRNFLQLLSFIRSLENGINFKGRYSPG